MEHDGYSLDDKRQKVAENDIPDVLDCWDQHDAHMLGIHLLEYLSDA